MGGSDHELSVAGALSTKACVTLELWRHSPPSHQSLNQLTGLLKKFSMLRHPSFAEATRSCIVSQGGPPIARISRTRRAFRPSLSYRNNNPGTAFSVTTAECSQLAQCVYALHSMNPDQRRKIQFSETFSRLYSVHRDGMQNYTYFG